MNIQLKNSAHHFRMQSEREQTLVWMAIYYKIILDILIPYILVLTNPVIINFFGISIA